MFRRLEKKDKESSISNVKSYGAGKALSLKGWKAKKVTELKSMLTRIGLHNLWFSELFIEPGKYIKKYLFVTKGILHHSQNQTLNGLCFIL